MISTTATPSGYVFLPISSSVNLSFGSWYQPQNNICLPLYLFFWETETFDSNKPATYFVSRLLTQSACSSVMSRVLWRMWRFKVHVTRAEINETACYLWLLFQAQAQACVGDHLSLFWEHRLFGVESILKQEGLLLCKYRFTHVWWKIFLNFMIRGIGRKDIRLLFFFTPGICRNSKCSKNIFRLDTLIAISVQSQLFSSILNWKKGYQSHVVFFISFP